MTDFNITLVRDENLLVGKLKKCLFVLGDEWFFQIISRGKQDFSSGQVEISYGQVKISLLGPVKIFLTFKPFLFAVMIRLN